MSVKKRKVKEAINHLQASKSKILDFLKKAVANGNFSYRTFGSAIEEHIADALIEIFKEGGFIKNKTDYAVAKDKNYFPDFELKTDPSLAIEFKAGNENQYRKGKWVKVKNSENDMGTLNKWPEKIQKFGGENIYYTFLIYDFDDKNKRVSSIEILPFYQFIGINSDGVLKYREKDGNLRPKDFGIKSPVKTLEQFEKLFNKTISYRSKRIVKKHQTIIKSLKKHPKVFRK